MPDSTSPCPCGSGVTYTSCCEPVVAGRAKAATAEATMRARYTAFATGAVDFLIDSHHTSTRGKLKRKDLEDWSKNSVWQGLEILASQDGGSEQNQGTVTFRARYTKLGKETVHEEHAKFEREDGAWRFVDGGPIPQAPVRREAPKVGRNDPCPCGSGKKYKKCCEGKA